METPAPHERSALDRIFLAWTGAFFVITLSFGLLLRWDLATATFTSLGLDFSHLRHAHSHVGFYGFLTLAWWIVARRDVRVSRGLLHVHAASVVLATALFAVMGYKAPTIILSTLIAGIWVLTAWRARRAPGWFGLVPLGIVLGMALIVPIAVTARRDLLLSRDLAHVFIAAMLFCAFIPVALGALRVPVVPRLPWVLTTLLSSTYLVFAERLHLPFSLGWFGALAGIALLLALRPALATMPRLLAASWLGLAAGLVVMGLAPPLQTEENRIVALHYTVLLPLSLTALHVLAPGLAARRPAAFVIAVTGTVVMLGAMVLAPLGDRGLAMRAAAVGGSVLVAGAALLVRPGGRPGAWPGRR